jgi:hypothetical protein
VSVHRTIGVLGRAWVPRDAREGGEVQVQPVTTLPSDEATFHTILTATSSRQSLQETTKSTRAEITYGGPLISYVIYKGRNPAAVS